MMNLIEGLVIIEKSFCAHIYDFPKTVTCHALRDSSVLSRFRQIEITGGRLGVVPSDALKGQAVEKLHLEGWCHEDPLGSGLVRDIREGHRIVVQFVI